MTDLVRCHQIHRVAVACPLRTVLAQPRLQTTHVNQTELYSLSHVYKPHTSIRQNCTRSATSTNHTRQSDRTVLAQPRLQTRHFNQTELYSLSHVYKPHTSIRQNCTHSATSTNHTLQSDRTVLAQPRLQTTHFNQTELYSLSHVYKPHTSIRVCPMVNFCNISSVCKLRLM